MKNIFIALLVTASLVSCNTSGSESKYPYTYTHTVNSNGSVKRILVVKNPFNDIEVEMEGTAAFNDDGTAITSLSPDGYIKYRNKDSKLSITAYNGKIIMTVENNGKKIPLTSDTGKEVIADAVKQVKKLQEKHK